MSVKNKKVLLFVCIILAGLVLRSVFVSVKHTWHVDEGISLALVNDAWPEQQAEAYKERWLPARDVQSYLFDRSIETRSVRELVPAISIQTSNDVHPPLYYWLLMIMRKIFGSSAPVTAAFILNVLFYLLSALLLLRISQKLRLDTLMTAAVLLCFAFARGSISSAVFFRMYEVLQFAVLLYVYSVLLLLEEKPVGKKYRLIPAYCMFFVSIVAGMLSHYYMLFVFVPFSVVGLLVLNKQKRFLVMGNAALLTLSGIYVAFLLFPVMFYHIFGSYRSTESSQTLFAAPLGERLWRIGQYMYVMAANLFSPLLAFILAAAALVLSRVLKFEKDDSDSIRHAGHGSLLFVTAAVFLFLIIALSAPYQTGRYIVAYIPLFILASACLFSFILRSSFELTFRSRRYTLSLASVLMLLLSFTALGTVALHRDPNGFHEDYVLDEDAYYLQDEHPVILLSTRDAWNWKNMLIYPNINPEKDLYVNDFPTSFSLENRARELARQKGSAVTYLILDDLFYIKPSFTRIGYYGFFDVYRIEQD